jgi:hypothetical protein
VIVHENRVHAGSLLEALAQVAEAVLAMASGGVVLPPALTWPI